MPPAHLYLMGYIYKITNRLNGCIYIGQTVKSVEERWRQHIGCARRGDAKYSKLDRAIRKYGVENFTVEQIEECPTEMLDAREIFWISEYQTFNTAHGYNLTSGGNRFEFSDETKLKMSRSRTGENNPFYGKKHSEETRRLISEMQTGEKSHCYGTHLSDVTKAKIKLGQCTPVVAYLDNGEEYRYYISIQSAQKSDRYTATHISKCLKGGCKTHGVDDAGNRLHWRIASPEESEMIKIYYSETLNEYMVPEDVLKYKRCEHNGNWNQNLQNMRQAV